MASPYQSQPAQMPFQPQQTPLIQPPQGVDQASYRPQSLPFSHHSQQPPASHHPQSPTAACHPQLLPPPQAVQRPGETIHLYCPQQTLTTPTAEQVRRETQTFTQYQRRVRKRRAYASDDLSSELLNSNETGVKPGFLGTIRATVDLACGKEYVASDTPARLELLRRYDHFLNHSRFGKMARVDKKRRRVFRREMRRVAHVLESRAGGAIGSTAM